MVPLMSGAEREMKILHRERGLRGLGIVKEGDEDGEGFVLAAVIREDGGEEVTEGVVGGIVGEVFGEEGGGFFGHPRVEDGLGEGGDAGGIGVGFREVEGAEDADAFEDVAEADVELGEGELEGV